MDALLKTKNGCKLVAKGKKDGKLFKLDVGIPELKAAMFSKGHRVLCQSSRADIVIWHKKIGHVNIQKFVEIAGGVARR